MHKEQITERLLFRFVMKNEEMRALQSEHMGCVSDSIDKALQRFDRRQSHIALILIPLVCKR